MDQAQMPGHELREGRLGLVGGVFPHQSHVVGHHPPITWTPTEEANKLISTFLEARRSAAEANQIGKACAETENTAPGPAFCVDRSRQIALP
jgi:hypothetical protein